jgi:hypothetical protein
VFRPFLLDRRPSEPVSVVAPAPVCPGPPAPARPPACLPACCSSLPAAAAARLCLRLSDKSADWVGGAVITAGVGHGGALRLHQVPPALPLRGAISGAAAVQGARARAATGNWGRWRRGPELPVLRGRPAGSLGQGVADPPS